jgi:hypothetical protein
MGKTAMSESKMLHFAKGILKVEAKGFWYSSGGDKASFGFCPHLKSPAGYPVFPDTQVHGDLRMPFKLAPFGWMLAGIPTSLPGFTPDLIDRVFGKEGVLDSALLHITDLELDQASMDKWSPRRFKVKPRIRIDDSTRTVEDGMLVSFELSYLDRLTLEARIFLGYFRSAHELSGAKQLIAYAGQIVSGFGAFRSRGYGRGKVSVEWEADETVQWQESMAVLYQGTHWIYLRPLVNLRNRQVEPGKDQLLASKKSIAGSQVRAWFVKAYHDVFNEWPGVDEMAGLSFSTCYPALEDGGQRLPGFPPPFSTHRYSGGMVRDTRGESVAERELRDAGALCKTKRHALSGEEFLTNEPEPRLIRVGVESRMRNAVQPSFATLDEGGLFAQELVRRGSLFCGRIKVDSITDKFARRARFVLHKLRPVINGAICESELVFDRTTSTMSPSAGPLLVAEPIPFNPVSLGRDGTQILVGNERRYNAQLRRPRRNRLVVRPGSIVVAIDERDKCLDWKGFKSTIRLPSPPACTTGAIRGAPAGNIPEDDCKKMGKMSRAQFGQVREFLYMPEDPARNKIEGILEKYADWKKKTIEEHLIPETVLRRVLELLSNRTELKRYLTALSDCYVQALWFGSGKNGKSLREKAMEELERERSGRNVHP